MIYCKKCGSEVPTGDVCPKCGATIEADVVIENGVVTTTPEKDPGKVLGIVSLVLGIVSIVGNCCSCIPFLGWFLPIFAIVGFILSIVGMKKSKNSGFKNTFALVGLIISIVGIIVAIVNIVISILFGGTYLLAMLASLAGASSSSYYYY